MGEGLGMSDGLLRLDCARWTRPGPCRARLAEGRSWARLLWIGHCCRCYWRRGRRLIRPCEHGGAAKEEGSSAGEICCAATGAGLLRSQGGDRAVVLLLEREKMGLDCLWEGGAGVHGLGLG